MQSIPLDELLEELRRREHTKQELGGTIDLLRQGLALLEP